MLHTLVVAGRFFQNNFFLQSSGVDATCKQRDKFFSVSRSIGQDNAFEILKWNVVSEISKVLLNDIFAEVDGSSGIKDIVSHTDRLNIGGLQVDDIRQKTIKSYSKLTKFTAESTYEEIIPVR